MPVYKIMAVCMLCISCSDPAASLNDWPQEVIVLPAVVAVPAALETVEVSAPVAGPPVAAVYSDNLAGAGVPQQPAQVEQPAEVPRAYVCGRLPAATSASFFFV